MADHRKTVDGKCPRCGGGPIKEHDCGYSSFNVGDWECASCGFKIGFGFSKEKIVANSWKEGYKRVKKLQSVFAKLTKKEIEVLGMVGISRYVKPIK